MQMLVSLQKLSRGMELIRTVMTDTSCRRGCILSRIYKKQLKGETAESRTLSVYGYRLRYGSNKPNLPSTEASFPRYAVDQVERSRSSPAICVEI